MTKRELAARVNLKYELTTQQVCDLIDDLHEVIMEEAAKGNPIYVRGFGTYGLKTRKKKIGRYIKENTPMEIPEHTIPYFKPSAEFKERVHKTIFTHQ